MPDIPSMANLPPSSLRLYKPVFYSTGLDCFGPFQIRVGRRNEKRWGILYKCLTTKAVYINLLVSIDSDSFLMSLRRFVSRRGKPHEILCDRGTNFKGGDTELKEAFQALQPALKEQLAAQQIAFQYNSPSAPHFGGSWEREIRSIKAALYTVVGAQTVPEEVLRTVLVEIEGILNSKPLGYVSSDIADPDPVTPNTLLMGRPDSSLPQVIYPESELLTRRRWRHSQILADQFWARFIRQYLPAQQTRQKWQKDKDHLTVGTVVMIVDPQSPRALWLVGTVKAVCPGSDGRISSEKPPLATDSSKQIGQSDYGHITEISPGTSRLGRTGLAKACVNTIPPVCHPPEVSMALQGNLSEGRQRGQSALFQLAEMCLASEANKTVTSTPRPGGQSTRGQARVNQGAPLSSPSISSCPSSLSASSTPSEDAPPWQGQLQNLKKKKKKKKKKNREGYGASEVIVSGMYPPSKPFKRTPSSESDLESLIDTIDAVAKGSWCTEHDRAEPPAKRPCPFSNPSLGKRKSRPIERKSSKPQVDEVVKEEEDHKPVLEGSPETEGQGEVPSVRDEAYACTLLTLAPPSPSAMPTNNDDKMAAQLEHSGSRKSERSCKGALYKTLVSEGMLTSLRASVDRGRRTSSRGSISDLEGNWAEDGWTFTQLGGNNSKKLKKAKLKEEYAPGLGKLEVQFEKKFNSLPQYSPLTFDRKTTCLTKKKKSGVNGLEDLPIPLRGSSPSMKKNSFHKIISKYKNRKEQPASMDKAMETQGLSGPHIIQVAKPAGPSPPPYPESPGGAEALVGSQKRKARKRKITHLVRTAEGRVSPAEGDRARETLDKELGPSNRKMLCNKERSGLQETCASTTLTADHPGESGHRAFFSLAALAEVAAMENVQRGQHTANLPQEGQSEEIALTHVLIYCGNQ
ncbi:hypothetical protein GJAV_G00059300 [Gymnothorax javanicus]|nr:hypothetical protein GJAV_G00059300 [Gymnothorax javanicus]